MALIHHLVVVFYTNICYLQFMCKSFFKHSRLFFLYPLPFFFFFLTGCNGGIWKFLGQGLNPCLHSDPSYGSQILNPLCHSGHSPLLFLYLGETREKKISYPFSCQLLCVPLKQMIFHQLLTILPSPVVYGTESTQWESDMVWSKWLETSMERGSESLWNNLRMCSSIS